LIVLRTVIYVFVVAVISLFTIDSIFYQRLTFTPLGFLKRNVLQGISLFYGASPVHFYFTSALPFIGFTLLPFALRGLWFAFNKPLASTFDSITRRWEGVRGERDPQAIKTLADCVIVFTLTMSLLGHKEVRFLQPIVPVIHIMQAYALVMIPPFRSPSWLQKRRDSNNSSQQNTSSRLAATVTSDLSSNAAFEEGQAALARQAFMERSKRRELIQSLTDFTSWQGRRHLLPPKPAFFSMLLFDKMRDVIRFIRVWHGEAALWLLALNLIPILYLSIHSIGQVRVAEYVGQLHQIGESDSVGFIMPCHSTPWMSHIHSKSLAKDSKRAWFITCEPPLDANINMKTYKDESDDFYDDPINFLRQRLGTETKPWPSHLVLFQALLHQTSHKGTSNDEINVAELLQEQGYTQKRTFWNSVFHPDHRRRGRVIVMERVGH
jgi:GPI mannosyltransferase 3